ncbi:hypothetical protein Goshw_014467 [Gossypium schwendimanii]|uniref:CCHC-type domain-containing protein n=1 Tax=Gossypium schwendimanii TaxID=34291 RepID=A0A7J9MT02_GOSSC|nr:hypothetical protein [Gossypium schwendimanii]
MEDELENLNLEYEEEEAIYGQEEEKIEEFRYCLVGRVLTESAIHFPSMKNVLAELWHPIESVAITKIEDKRILSRFYNEIDIQRVVNDIPWFFNRYMIIFHRLMKGKNSLQGMAQQLGNFIGVFLGYDTLFATKGEKQYMRIRVNLDVRSPLRRNKQIIYGREKTTFATFQCEKLSLFCFLCGRLGHRESFCLIQLTLGAKEREFGWDITLQAPPKRATPVTSEWLREEPNVVGRNKVYREDLRGNKKVEELIVDANGGHRTFVNVELENTKNVILSLKENLIDFKDRKKRQRT